MSWPKSKGRAKSNKGLTLLEVMVALVIFSVGFMCLLPMIVTAIRGNEFANDYTKATDFASSKMDELKATHSFVGIPFGSAVACTDFVENMQRVWTVTHAAADTHYYQIVVEISWTDHYGKAHKYSSPSGESTTEL